MYCASCGTQIAEGATSCPSCGRSIGGSVQAIQPSTRTSSGLADNVAGMIAYITIIPAVILLVVDPYNRRPFVRFHAFQSLFLGVAGVVIGIALRILLMIPVFGLLTLFIAPFVWLGMLVLSVIALWRAYQGQMWKIPFIGEYAEKQAGVVAASPATGTSSGTRAA